MTSNPAPWTTLRTACGRGRVTYHPEWDATNPWATYVGGAAGRHLPNLAAAESHFRQLGMGLKTPEEPTP